MNEKFIFDNFHFCFQQLRNIDFGFFIYMLALLTGLSNLFLYCFFGKFATHSFEKMIRSLYEFNWMHLSVDLQKYVILMIINAQKPLFYHGFGIVTLNLETFTKVRYKISAVACHSNTTYQTEFTICRLSRRLSHIIWFSRPLLYKKE